MKVVIIGAGISGLTAGIYALKQGYEAEIYEKNTSVGGMCTGWYRKGTYIDGCLHWLTESAAGSLYEIWEETGALDDSVEIFDCDVFYRAVYEGKDIDFYTDADRLEQALLSYAEQGDEKLIRGFIKAVKKAKKNSVIPTKKPFHLWKIGDMVCYMLKMLPMLPAMKKYSKLSIRDFAGKMQSKSLRFAFENFMIPSEFSMISLVSTFAGLAEKNSGIPLGGSKAFAKRMERRFMRMGGRIHLNEEISEIAVERGRAHGIVDRAGKLIQADYVIAACDLHYTADTLLKGKYRIEELDERDKDKQNNPTYSLILISYRTDENLTGQIHNVFYQTDEYEILGKKFNVIGIKHFGYDPTIAADGKTVVQVVINTDERMYKKLQEMGKEEYDAFKEQIAEKMKMRVYAAAGERYGELETLDVAMPRTFAHYVNSYMGTFMTYMLTKNSRQMMVMNNALPLDNVILANQWLMAPGGTPVAAIEGKFAAMTIAAMENGKSS